MRVRAIRVLEYDFDLDTSDPTQALNEGAIEASNTPDSAWAVVHTDVEIIG